MDRSVAPQLEMYSFWATVPRFRFPPAPCVGCECQGGTHPKECGLREEDLRLWKKVRKWRQKWDLI